MIPMPVSLADANADVADLNCDVFRDDHWFVAGAQRTGKCRHGQERNNKKGKQRILHDTLFWLARPLATIVGRMRVFCSCSLYRIDQHAIWNDTSMRPLPSDTKQINNEDTAMDKDRIKGSAEQAKGAVKETAGKILGDKKLETDGKTDKAAGKVQNAIGGLKDAVRGK